MHTVKCTNLNGFLLADVEKLVRLISDYLLSLFTNGRVVLSFKKSGHHSSLILLHKCIMNIFTSRLDVNIVTLQRDNKVILK